MSPSDAADPPLILQRAPARGPACDCCYPPPPSGTHAALLASSAAYAAAPHNSVYCCRPVQLLPDAAHRVANLLWLPTMDNAVALLTLRKSERCDASDGVLKLKSDIPLGGALARSLTTCQYQLFPSCSCRYPSCCEHQSYASSSALLFLDFNSLLFFTGGSSVASFVASSAFFNGAFLCTKQSMKHTSPRDEENAKNKGN